MAFPIPNMGNLDGTIMNAFGSGALLNSRNLDSARARSLEQEYADIAKMKAMNGNYVLPDFARTDDGFDQFTRFNDYNTNNQINGQIKLANNAQNNNLQNIQSNAMATSAVGRDNAINQQALGRDNANYAQTGAFNKSNWGAADMRDATGYGQASMRDQTIHDLALQNNKYAGAGSLLGALLGGSGSSGGGGKIGTNYGAGVTFSGGSGGGGFGGSGDLSSAFSKFTPYGLSDIPMPTALPEMTKREMTPLPEMTQLKEPDYFQINPNDQRNNPMVKQLQDRATANRNRQFAAQPWNNSGAVAAAGRTPGRM